MSSAPSIIIPIQAETARMPEPQTRGFILNIMRDLTLARMEIEIRRVALAGFNVLIFPMYNNGWTLFPCETAEAIGFPRINPHFKKWDPLAEVVRLCDEHGLAAWGFARLHDFNPRYSVVEHKLLRRFPRWRMRAHPTARGAKSRLFEERHACPLNIEYRRYVADLLAEAVSRYPITGLMLNYKGLGLVGGSLEHGPFCFCPHCVELYAKSFDGADLIADAAGEKLVQVRRWQLQEAHDQLSYLRLRIARTRRTLRLICRATPDWRYRDNYRDPLANGSILMDWPHLLESGIVEELAVDHDGERAGPQFSSRVAADFAHLGDRGLFLPMVIIEQLDDLRRAAEVQNRLPVPGLIAEFNEMFSEEDAQYIRERFFMDAAELPETSPIMTAAWLLDRVRRSFPNVPVLRDMLGDILRLLSRQLPMPNDFDLLVVLEENLHGLEQAIRRKKIDRLEITESIMCDLGLARRFIRLACLDVRS